MFYGNGFANRMIGKVLPEGNGVVVASKVGADPQIGGAVPMRLAQRPEQLRATVEENLGAGSVVLSEDSSALLYNLNVATTPA